MEAAVATKKEEKKKSRSVSPDAAVEEFSSRLQPGKTEGLPLFLQAKLAISQPADPFEQEADRVAEQVMRMPDPTLQRTCAPCTAGGPPCAKCQEEGLPRVQRQPEPTQAAEPEAVPDDFVVHLGSGRPLDGETRAYFEPRFKRDFSDVRVYTDADAQRSAHDIEAHAYTLGKDVVFSAGKFAPQTEEGKRLLAHELTHVLQQSASGTRQLSKDPVPSSSQSVPPEPGAPLELPVQFIAEPLLPTVDSPAIGATDLPVVGGTPQIPGYPLSVVGLGGNILASGDLSWLSRPDAARRLLSAEYWSPFVPRRGYETLDRLTDVLPRNLYPRIQSELATGGPFSWVQRRGFTEAELRSIPDLVRRWNLSQGPWWRRWRGNPLSASELALLRYAAKIHIGATTPGSPFVSFSRMGRSAPFLTGPNAPRFRVRMEIPRLNVLDVSAPNAFNLGQDTLTNISEAELMAIANHEGRILNVQRNSGSVQPGFLMRNAHAIRWGGRILFVAGLGYSGYRISQATPEELPVVVSEEVGGHLGGGAGTALGAAGCVFLGITTGGFGLLVCGLVGGFVGGAVGGAAAGGLAEFAQRGFGDATVCPSCHALQREWERDRWDRDGTFPNIVDLGFDRSLLPADAVPLSLHPDNPGADLLDWLAQSPSQPTE